ncbi:hypothetical protein ACIMS2_003348 [Vibrio harveyi]
MSSGLAVEEDNIKIAPFPYANNIVILWNLYPSLTIIKTVLSETNQLNALKGTTLKSVNHASNFTVFVSAISQ